MSEHVKELLELVENSLAVDGAAVKVVDAAKFRKNVGKLVERSALGSDSTVGWSRYLANDPSAGPGPRRWPGQVSCRPLV
ncbi:MAG TPA: hypothetical protein PKN81_09310, partial [Anaerolineales bacterium]|nr:hypothetical protein [Anaerolineales bacterium]